MLTQAVHQKEVIILDVHTITPDEFNDTVKAVEDYVDLEQFDLALTRLQRMLRKVDTMVSVASELPLRRVAHPLSMLFVLQDTLNFMHGVVSRMQARRAS